MWRHDGVPAERDDEGAGGIVLVGTVHQQDRLALVRAGASCAWLGESASVKRAAIVAGERVSLVVPLPHERPIAYHLPFRRSRRVRVQLDDRAVQRDHGPLFDQLSVERQLGRDSLQHAPLGQVEHCVEHLEVRTVMWPCFTGSSGAIRSYWIKAIPRMFVCPVATFVLAPPP